MKLFHFENIFENFRTQIFKINFRHEKLIFFVQDFFSRQCMIGYFDMETTPGVYRAINCV